MALLTKRHVGSGNEIGYIGFAESMGHAHKTLNLENSDLTENGYTRNTGDVRK